MSWISVKDKLPEKGLSVLICNSEDRMCIAYLDEIGDWITESFEEDYGYSEDKGEYAFMKRIDIVPVCWCYLPLPPYDLFS